MQTPVRSRATRNVSFPLHSQFFPFSELVYLPNPGRARECWLWSVIVLEKKADSPSLGFSKEAAGRCLKQCCFTRVSEGAGLLRPWPHLWDLLEGTGHVFLLCLQLSHLANCGGGECCSCPEHPTLVWSYAHNTPEEGPGHSSSTPTPASTPLQPAPCPIPAFCHP